MEKRRIVSIKVPQEGFSNEEKEKEEAMSIANAISLTLKKEGDEGS